MGTGELRWCGTQFPTNGDAQNAGMSLEEYEDFVYAAGYLYEADPVAKWEEMAAWQEKWVNYLDGKKELHILSKDTDIKVNIAGRKWINCCGDANFPDGEIFTSPVEDGIDGYITFSYPSIMNGNEFYEVRLVVEKAGSQMFPVKMQKCWIRCFLISTQIKAPVISVRLPLVQITAFSVIQKIFFLMKKSVVPCIWRLAKLSRKQAAKMNLRSIGT